MMKYENLKDFGSLNLLLHVLVILLPPNQLLFYLYIL